MAAVINDRDTLLLGSPQRGSNPLTASLLLSLSASVFHVNTSNVGLPSTITVTADLINLVGTVSFSATGATVTNNGDNTAAVAFNSLTGDAATIKATVNSLGEVYTKSIQISKVYDGKQGNDGATGNQYATVFLYQFSTATPAKPTGTSGYTWATGVNSTYGANDGWSTSPPNNPGGSNTKLYIATVNITAPSGTASTIVSYANSTVAAWAQNGAAGADGVSGVQQGTAVVFQWAASIPLAPIGSATFSWVAGTFDVPNGWSVVPPNPPSQGITLWAARVNIVDSAKNTQTGFNWSAASVYVAGNSGSNGTTGSQGASYVIAYCASNSVTATSAPQTTTGKNSVPAPNSGGITGTWSKNVPTLSTDQRMFQSDGIYDPVNDTVIWSMPYWSVFKAGSISAITTNTGRLTVTDTISDGSGNWSIDSNGHMIAKSADFIDPATNEVVLSIGGKLNPKYAPNETLNSNVSLPSLGQHTFRAITQGGSNTIPIGTLGLFMDGARICDVGDTYTLAVIRRSDRAVVFSKTYNVLTGGNDIASVLASDLNNVALGYIAVLMTYNEPQSYHDNPDLVAAICRCGGSRAMFSNLRYRSAYILVGYGGVGEGGGTEGYAGSIDSDPNAWCEVSFTMLNGNITSVSGSALPSKAIADGVNAAAAIPSINTSLAAKLQADSHATLTGQLSLQAKYALLVGDQDNGIYYGGTGIYGRKNGLTTFGIGADGSATYSGALYGKIVNAENINVDSLSAVSGTIGTLRTSTSGERTEISDNVIKMFSSNNQKILHIGDSSK